MKLKNVSKLYIRNKKGKLLISHLIGNICFSHEGQPNITLERSTFNPKIWTHKKQEHPNK